MKTQQQSVIRMARFALSMVAVLACTLLLDSVARAEKLSDYQPLVLTEAEQALERGQPERALSLLNRERAILSHGKFRSQGEALACQAYIQKGDLHRAQQVCEELLAQAGAGAAKGAYEPVGK